MKQALTIITCSLMLLRKLTATCAQKAATPDVTESDVIVDGSTPSGFCAAIAAAREQATLILLEPIEPQPDVEAECAPADSIAEVR